MNRVNYPGWVRRLNRKLAEAREELVDREWLFFSEKIEMFKKNNLPL